MAFGWDQIIPLLLGGMSLFGGGSDQERESFSREAWDGVNLDPRKLLATGLTQQGELGEALTNRANKPVRLRSAYAQSPPTFAGGGLPMPIGLTGRDPALDDPSLLELEGLGIDSSIFGGVPSGPVRGNPGPQNGDPLDGAPKPPYRTPPYKGQDIMSGGTEEQDPMSEAFAAIDLLNASMRS